MKIGSVTLENNLFLAPMAGVTDKAFRMITKPFGPALMYTEMVSGKGLHYQNKRTGSLLECSAGERPVAVQLFGHEPEILAESAENALLGGAALLDINMGCPAPKIVNNGDGCALMKSPKLAGDIIAAVCKKSPVPVTVKFRAGWDNAHKNAVEFAKIAEANAAAAITVHGRTREAFYSGSADWDIIRQVREAVSVPVIANGDTRDEDSAASCLAQTGCHGLMIGRAAWGNPWIFREILHFLEIGERLSPPSLEERIDKALEHFDLLIQYKGEHRGVQEGRKHMSRYFLGIVGGSRLRDRINHAETPAEMRAILEALRYTPQKL